MIFTLTMNPCLDRFLYVDDIVPDDTIRVKNVKDYPAGKGIDVSRVIEELEGETAAITIIGGKTGENILYMLQEEGVITIPVWIKSETRTNIMLQSNKSQYRMSLPTYEINNNDIELIRDIIKKFIKKDSTIVISGSLPNGLNKDFYRKIIKDLSKDKIKVYFDADGELLKEGIKSSPYCIKPNIHELERLTGKKLNNENEIINEVKKLKKEYSIDIILVSLGEKGAMAFSKDEIFLCEPIKIKPKSAVGAGDSFLAAFAYYKETLNKTFEESLKAANAAGAATALTPGTELLHKETFEKFVEKSIIKKIKT